jgi:hypothetical protein
MVYFLFVILLTFSHQKMNLMDNNSINCAYTSLVVIIKTVIGSIQIIRDTLWGWGMGNKEALSTMFLMLLKVDSQSIQQDSALRDTFLSIHFIV